MGIVLAVFIVFLQYKSKEKEKKIKMFRENWKKDETCERRPL
jgi:hypothetical protein